eukprot:1190061-Prorocentrum_minimum.AAC.1
MDATEAATRASSASRASSSLRRRLRLRAHCRRRRRRRAGLLQRRRRLHLGDHHRALLPHGGHLRGGVRLGALVQLAGGERGVRLDLHRRLCRRELHQRLPEPLRGKPNMEAGARVLALRDGGVGGGVQHYPRRRLLPHRRALLPRGALHRRLPLVQRRQRLLAGELGELSLERGHLHGARLERARLLQRGLRGALHVALPQLHHRPRQALRARLSSRLRRRPRRLCLAVLRPRLRHHLLPLLHLQVRRRALRLRLVRVGHGEVGLVALPHHLLARHLAHLHGDVAGEGVHQQLRLHTRRRGRVDHHVHVARHRVHDQVRVRRLMPQRAQLHPDALATRLHRQAHRDERRALRLELDDGLQREQRGQLEGH